MKRNKQEHGIYWILRDTLLATLHLGMKSLPLFVKFTLVVTNFTLTEVPVRTHFTSVFKVKINFMRNYQNFCYIIFKWLEIVQSPGLYLQITWIFQFYFRRSFTNFSQDNVWMHGLKKMFSFNFQQPTSCCFHICLSMWDLLGDTRH